MFLLNRSELFCSTIWYITHQIDSTTISVCIDVLNWTLYRLYFVNVSDSEYNLVELYTTHSLTLRSPIYVEVVVLHNFFYKFKFNLINGIYVYLFSNKYTCCFPGFIFVMIDILVKNMNFSLDLYFLNVRSVSVIAYQICPAYRFDSYLEAATNLHISLSLFTYTFS